MIENEVKKLNLPDYKKRILVEKYYDGSYQSIDQITSLSQIERDHISPLIKFRELKKHKIIKREEFAKAVLTTENDEFIETVLMKEQDHYTVCLSTQIGCPAGCLFCASGQVKFRRNLTTREIVEQYIFWHTEIPDEKANIVFMGMGEPLLNLENVQESIKIFTDEEKVNLSSRKITISTIGITEPLKRLLSKKNQFRIALSLHSPIQKERERLIPLAKSNHLKDIMKILSDYAVNKNKRISIEYVMLKDINDTKEHAYELIRLLEIFPRNLVFVNLIKYNEVPAIPKTELKIVGSETKQIFRFAELLRKANITNFVRFSKGDQTESACGQLAYELNHPDK